MFQKPKLIIVTGLAASGKSWLANEISKALSIPQFQKDPFKIEILKQLGVRDRSWDIQVGITAVKIQIHNARELLLKKVPVILESNYKQQFDTVLLLELIEYTASDCLQILCGAEGKVLVERYIQRTHSGERPKELNEVCNIPEFTSKLQIGFDEPLQLPGELIRVDTTDFSKVSLSEIILSVREFLDN